MVEGLEIWMIEEKEIERITAIVRNSLDLSAQNNEEEVRNLIAQTVYKETLEGAFSLKDKENAVAPTPTLR